MQVRRISQTSRLWFLIIGLWLGMGTPVAHAQQGAVSLTELNFYLVGGELMPQPTYQAVPKSLTTQVDVPFELPDEVKTAGMLTRG